MANRDRRLISTGQFQDEEVSSNVLIHMGNISQGGSKIWPFRAFTMAR